MAPFRTTRRVEFAQTDAAGIMHFASFFPLLESVEHEFLRSLGLSVLTKEAGDTISWPRVSAQCEYRGAAKFEDVLDVTLYISRLGEKSVTYAFAVSRGGQPVADSQITAVCCRVHEGTLTSIAIPAKWREKLASFTN